jgi:hypothetical protein
MCCRSCLLRGARTTKAVQLITIDKVAGGMECLPPIKLYRLSNPTQSVAASSIGFHLATIDAEQEAAEHCAHPID